jgi:hypothetical protein
MSRQPALRAMHSLTGAAEPNRCTRADLPRLSADFREADARLPGKTTRRSRLECGAPCEPERLGVLIRSFLIRSSETLSGFGWRGKNGRKTTSARPVVVTTVACRRPTRRCAIRPIQGPVGIVDAPNEIDEFVDGSHLLF